MSDGFLGRWSRRKLDAKEGKPVAAEPPLQPAATDPAEPGDQLPVPPAPAGQALQPAGEAPPPVPPPTLEDVQALTAESDFARFAARDVAPEVKNAALKKLFADPRYNVMDGLDVYIDDYSKPDPMPGGMARRLAGAAFLRLFDEAAPDESLPARDVADNHDVQSVAQSGTDSATVPSDDDDPDLRLQQDDAAASGGTGPGAG